VIKIKQNAFTIVELLVAMGLLVMMLTLSGLVFNTTVKTHRAAGATVDITRSLGAITSQLSADFRGLRTDAPLTIWFEQRWPVDKNGNTAEDLNEYLRYDQIQFFADGDFQSTKLYDSNGDAVPDDLIYGNTARIYYGHAWTVDPSSPASSKAYQGYRPFIQPADSEDLDPACILARRVNIETAKWYYVEDNTQHLFPLVDTTNPAKPLLVLPPALNNKYEFDLFFTVTQWKQLLTDPDNGDTYLSSCFNNNYTPNTSVSGRPVINLNFSPRLHTLLSQGVLQMAVQWAYTPADLNGAVVGFTQGIRWWPSPDPNGDGNLSDSDFGSAAMNRTQFGVHFNLSGGTTLTDWLAVQNCGTSGIPFKNTFYPKALKFTFTLRDSNGLFTDGKTFTHIVYLDS
jgi:type II secretory pathway pseudopilin PulG